MTSLLHSYACQYRECVTQSCVSISRGCYTIMFVNMTRVLHNHVCQINEFVTQYPLCI